MRPLRQAVQESERSQIPQDALAPVQPRGTGRIGISHQCECGNCERGRWRPCADWGRDVETIRADGLVPFCTVRLTRLRPQKDGPALASTTLTFTCQSSRDHTGLFRLVHTMLQASPTPIHNPSFPYVTAAYTHRRQDYGETQIASKLFFPAQNSSFSTALAVSVLHKYKFLQYSTVEREQGSNARGTADWFDARKGDETGQDGKGKRRCGICFTIPPPAPVRFVIFLALFFVNQTGAFC